MYVCRYIVVCFMSACTYVGEWNMPRGSFQNCFCYMFVSAACMRGHQDKIGSYQKTVVYCLICELVLEQSSFCISIAIFSPFVYVHRIDFSERHTFGNHNQTFSTPLTR